MYMCLAVVLLTMPLLCGMILLDADCLILTAFVSVFFSARTKKGYGVQSAHRARTQAGVADRYTRLSQKHRKETQAEKMLAQ
jgi:hypothetical protein